MRVVGPAVLDAPLAGPLVQDQAQAVVGRLAVGQDVRRRHLVDQPPPAQRARAQVVEPERQVADRRVDPAGPHRAVEVDRVVPPAVVAQPVALGAVRDHDRRVGPDDRVRHAQRSEHVLGHPLGERLAAHALDDHRREHVARVVVVPDRARSVLERRLALDDLDHLRPVERLAQVDAPPSERQRVQELAVAARVREQVAEGDRRAQVGQLREVLADVVVQAQRAALGQEPQGERRELLGRGADVGPGVGRHRDAVGQVGQPVGPLEHDLAVVHDGHQRAGAGAAEPAGHRLVDAAGRRRRDRLDAVERDRVVAGRALEP